MENCWSREKNKHAIMLFDKRSDRGSRECSGSTEQSIRVGGGPGKASQEKATFQVTLGDKEGVVRGD